jgi:hypothetical protein
MKTLEEDPQIQVTLAESFPEQGIFPFISTSVDFPD